MCFSSRKVFSDDFDFSIQKAVTEKKGEKKVEKERHWFSICFTPEQQDWVSLNPGAKNSLSVSLKKIFFSFFSFSFCLCGKVKKLLKEPFYWSPTEKSIFKIWVKFLSLLVHQFCEIFTLSINIGISSQVWLITRCIGQCRQPESFILNCFHSPIM